jgi:hypothetical protein
MWWVRKKLQHEQASFLPPTLAIRKELDDTLEAVAAAGTEAEVRELVAGINARIRRVNATATTDPPSTVGPLDVERWSSGGGPPGLSPGTERRRRADPWPVRPRLTPHAGLLPDVASSRCLGCCPPVACDAMVPRSPASFNVRLTTRRGAATRSDRPVDAALT